MQNSASTPLSLQPKTKIKNWIWSSIFVTLAIFPTAIVGLVYGIIAGMRFKSDNIEGAKKAAKSARIWTKVSFCIGVVLGIIELIYFIKTNKTFDHLLFNYTFL